MDATEEALRLCRAELAQVQAALEAALETQAEDRRRRELAEHQAEQLSLSILRQLSASSRSSGLAGRLRPRGAEAAEIELIRSSALLDGAWYLRQHPDVVDSGLSPAEHYLRVGAAQGWDPGPDFSTTDYLRGHPEVAKSGENPLVHRLRAQ